MILRVNKSKETELSTKSKPDEENSLSTKESFTGKIGVTIGDLDKYKKDSLINIWKDANAYYSSGEEWTDEDAEFFDELAVRINTATEEGIGTVSGPAVGMVANKEFDYKNNEDEKAIKDEGLNGDDGLGFGQHNESLDQILLNENYIQDQFGVFYRPVYVGENYKEHKSDLVFEGKLYTNEGVGNCPFCKGAGKITVEKLGLKDCPDCDGTGDVQGEQEMPPQEVPQQEEEPTDVFGKISPKPKKKSKEHYDKDGTYWFTTDGGRKIGVKKGQTLEDALSASGIPDDGVDQSDVTAEDMAKNEDIDDWKPEQDIFDDPDNNPTNNEYPEEEEPVPQTPEGTWGAPTADTIKDWTEDQLESAKKSMPAYRDIYDKELKKRIENKPREDKKADGKTSMGMKDVDVVDNNMRMSSNDSGGLDLSLNQDGWSWSGDETDLVDYVSRIAGSSRSDEFIEQLKDVPFDKLKEQMVKNIDDNPDVFYSLSGDSRRWKYGMDEDGDLSYKIDEEIEQMEEELTEEQIEQIKENVWENMDSGSYEEFMESWQGKKLKDDFTKELEESDSLEDLVSRIKDENGLGYDIAEAEMLYNDDQSMSAIRKTIEDITGSGDNEDTVDVDKQEAMTAFKDHPDKWITDDELSESWGVDDSYELTELWYNQGKLDRKYDDNDTDKTYPKYKLKKGITSFESKANESCGCKTKAFEASISKYEKFIKSEINVLKTRAKAGEAVGLMYGLPTVRKNGKKIKGTLAYAGVSLNDRIYLPEELAKGHGKTLPLLLNHSSTAGAEEELDRLDGEMRDHLENEKDYEVGEVTLTWDADKLTLFYEGVIENEFFQKEVDDMDMAVSLGIFYDSNSPKVCDEECYTLIKGAEFREVSLVYHAGFPIATIEAVESKLKRASIKDIKAKANEDSLIKVEDKNDDDTKVTVLDEWKSKGESIAEEEDELPRGGSIDAEPKETDTIEQPQIIVESLQTQDSFSVRGVSGMTISNSNGVEKYAFDPTQNYSTNTIHFSVTEQGGTIFGEEMQLTPKMTTPDELTKEIESKPDIKFTDADEDILKKN